MVTYEETKASEEYDRLYEIFKTLEKEESQLRKLLLPNTKKEINKMKEELSIKLKQITIERRILKIEFDAKVHQLRKNKNKLKKEIPELVEKRKEVIRAAEEARIGLDRLREIQSKNEGNDYIIERGLNQNGIN